MITVSRRSYIEATSPEEVFAALADPTQIGTLMPRFEKVELLNYNEEARTARMVTHMAMGGIFGTIRCEGDLTWVEPSEIVFKVETPVPVETRWILTSETGGTDLFATMSLDLAPMLGPMVAFVPKQLVSDILAGELESALKTVSENSSRQRLQSRAIAA
ncbi:cyclase/dehydrase [Oscillochloris trichoides DG-6]|uniref:Cyclase/dehydrase n=1 Tax=Oscillochloris trichoides DG-6 TaxID=765420 RepID=E1ICL5_9CHLR|nr:SRPBCC family protein [Oscillochloris trichoides]EFO81082.1 cyclase/dehydrase [Oscillochloris trichoides DG-6]